MLRHSLSGAARSLAGMGTMAAIVLLSGCQFISSNDATSGIDRTMLGGNHTAIQMNVSGQSAMLGTNCTRALGRELWEAKQRGATMEELRETLRSRCGTNPQAQMNNRQSVPARGRLFAPVRESSASPRTYSDTSTSSTYYSWFWRPFWWWSPEPRRNVQWCRRFFNNWWDDGSCFSLFYDFVSYQHYRPYCYHYCTMWTQTSSNSSSSSSTSTSIAHDPCVAAGCYGQWWWRY